MYLPILILIIIVAIALILIVMVQNPKGGGLSSSFGGGGQSIGGVQNTNNFLDQATWILAIAMFALILVSNFAIDRGNADNAPTLNNALDGVETSAPASTPASSTTKDTVK